MASISSSSPVIEYFHLPGSPAGDMILFMLYEKGVQFSIYYVDTHDPNNIDPHLLNFHVDGELPILRIDDISFADAHLAIEHLENIFADGPFPKLVPAEGTEERETCNYFMTLLKNVSISGFYYISLAMPKCLTIGQKMLMEHNLADAMEFKRKFMQTCMYENLSAYAEKVKLLELDLEASQDPDNVKNKLDDIFQILDFAHERLISRPQNMWLYGNQITCIDVEFCVLLRHLEISGLGAPLYFPVFPEVVSYFENVKHYEGFQKTFNKNLKQKSTFGFNPNQGQIFFGCCVFIAAVILNLLSYWLGF